MEVFVLSVEVSCWPLRRNTDTLTFREMLFKPTMVLFCNL